MSYNIDSVDTQVLNARMRAADIVALLDEGSDELPEDNFLYELRDAAMASLVAGDPDREIPLTEFAWCSEGSGHAYEFLLEEVAPKIRGQVDAIFTWEGGDSHSGLRIVDGVVTECDVVMTLVPKATP